VSSSQNVLQINILRSITRDLVDTYSLDVGIRTVHVAGSRLLLNNKPVYLAGCGMHEDFHVDRAEMSSLIHSLPFSR